jgi:hypothetical protein
MDNQREINYHIWENNVHEVILGDIEKINPTRINIFAAEEHEVNSLWSGPEFSQFKNLFIKNNIEVNFIFGAANMDFYNNRYHFPENNIRTYLWPEYYMCFSLSSAFHNDFFKQDLSNLKYTIPFISMNNRPHSHRSLFMDILAKHDLIDKGAISWHNENSDYDWQYWKNNRKLVLNDNFETTWNSYFLPKEWNNSFMNLVSECSVNRIYFSEKTWIPVICQKPFLSQSGQYFYKIFQELGFVIYDEIFDYSFDSNPNLEERTNSIIQNTKNIIGKDYEELYSIIEPKLKHNFNRVMEIAKSDNHVIPIVKNSKYAMDRYRAVENAKSIALDFEIIKRK